MLRARPRVPIPRVFYSPLLHFGGGETGNSSRTAVHMCSFVGFVSLSISPDCKRDTLKVGVNPELDQFLKMKLIKKKKGAFVSIHSKCV